MIRSIYAKIFLWFCLAIGLTVVIQASVTLVGIHSQTLVKRWMTEVLDRDARSAVDIYKHGGRLRLEEYLNELKQSARIRAALLDPNLRDIVGRGVPSRTKDVLAEALATGRSQFRTGIPWTGASVVAGPNGRFILVAAANPRWEILSSRWLRRRGVRLAITLLAGALLSLCLARHITAPIRALQAMARRIAEGDLSVRVAPAISPRNDELADLAQDFDRMADRIQSVLRKQQELLGDISHELRSPLTRLSVFLELMRRGDADAIERMQADLDRLDTLIGQILTLTRIETHHHPTIETCVNLRAILESVAEDARFEGKKEGKSIVIARADDCWSNGDPALLRSCIENVVRNAVRYTKPHTSVVLTLDLFQDNSSHSARILVADHGDGVPPQALERLFEPFYRVSGSRDRQTGGSGLGLSIAQRIVVLYGGKIVAWNSETRGLEVEIRLPATNIAAPASRVIGYQQSAAEIEG
jgi:two-component system, OmpR family, sensor histidine kinase CpxA